MQTLQEIREMLEQMGLAPQKRFGQNFLFDQNLLAKMVELAEVGADQTVLEVGPGTGSLTEELLARAGRVVAVEIDNGLYRLLSQRFADQPKLTLLHQDILVGKHAIEPAVLEALGPRANLVANLPYNIATPLVAQCLVSSWQAQAGKLSERGAAPVLFERLTFTVQQEVAWRLVAEPDRAAYGPASVIVAILGRCQFGSVVPNTAFWPRPQVTSRVVRIDFMPAQAAELQDVRTLKALVALTFGQRRKQIGSVVRRKNAAFAPDDFLAALEKAGIERTIRAEQVTPRQFLVAANALAARYAPREGDDEAQAIED